jgi:hypothetical protein
MGDLLFLAWDSEAGVLRARGTRPHGAGELTEQAVQRRIGALIARPFPPGTSSADVLGSVRESLGLGADAGQMRVLSSLRRRGDEELLALSRILYDLEAMRLGLSGAQTSAGSLYSPYTLRSTLHISPSVA